MKRGDIGAIGDDLPSIFPIVAGVLLFITAILYVNPQYEARNDYLELRKAGLALSYFAVPDGYISDKQFDDNCPLYRDFASRRGVKFVFSLKKACKYVDLEGDVFNSESVFDGGVLSRDPAYSAGKICSSEPSGLPKVNGQPISKVNLPRDFQFYNFPVAAQCDSEGSLKGVGIANIVVWQK